MGKLSASNRPAAFQRPSIDLGGEKREWRTVPWDDIYEGDIVAEEGLVSHREDKGDVLLHQTARSIKMTPKNSGPEYSVFAFVKING